MSLRDAIILRAAAGWTFWIWGTRIFNILENRAHSVSFKVVHSLLALVSVAFAGAILFVASKNRRRTTV